MTPFSILAPAKVNLALHVLGRRADGYHDLDSIVAFADVGDELTFSPAPSYVLTAGGPFASALPDPGQNAVTAAWKLAGELAGRRGLRLPPAALHLDKRLPVASGIGGGSSNAAAALRGFLRLAGIGEIDAEILAAALSLGADVPVCLAGKACRMRGIGERISALRQFRPRRALLVNPRMEVSTAAVFGRLGLARGQSFGEPIADDDAAHGWRNDLAAPAMALAPVIAEVIAELRRLPGVSRAFMSGSGATCVALIEEDAGMPRLARDDWWSAAATLS